MEPGDVVDLLRQAGAARGDVIALVVTPSTATAIAGADGSGRNGPIGLPPSAGVGLALPGGRSWAVLTPDPAAAVHAVEAELAPRWAVWSQATAALLAADGVRIGAELGCRRRAPAAVRRLAGRSRTHLGTTRRPLHRRPACGRPGRPVQPGRRRPRPDRPRPRRRPPQARLDRRRLGRDRPSVGRVGAVLADVAVRRSAPSPASPRADRAGLRRCRPGPRPMAASTAHAESAAELLCAELAVDGLPMDRRRGRGAHRRVRRAPPRDGGRGRRSCARHATPRCSATRPRAPRSTCAARAR